MRWINLYWTVFAAFFMFGACVYQMKYISKNKDNAENLKFQLFAFLAVYSALFLLATTIHGHWPWTS